MLTDESFSTIVDLQEINHCGPTSLATCLALLGIRTNQRTIARAAGKPIATYREGLDENELRRVARKYAAKCEFIQELDKRKGHAFLARLRQHIDRGLPGIVLVDNCNHWVATLGMLGGRFVVMDPLAENEFGLWSAAHLLRNRAWNLDLGAEAERRTREDQFFAILVSRQDGRDAAWMISGPFLKLCTRGSVQRLEDLTKDLREVAARASATPEKKPTGDNLADVLAQHTDAIVDSVNYWSAADTVNVRDLRCLLRDYQVVAAAARIRLTRRWDPARLIAQVSALVAAYLWSGTL